MEPDKIKESTQFAGKLYQAVLSLKPGQFSTRRHAHRMAQALALAKSMAGRPAEVSGSAALSSSGKEACPLAQPRQAACTP